MTILIIDIISTLAKTAMIFGVVGMSVYSIYLIHKKSDHNHMTNNVGIIEKTVKGLVKFGYFLADKIKK